MKWLARRLVEGDERFAVTGASGWLGRTTLEFFWAALGPVEAQRRVNAFASVDKTIGLRDGTKVEVRPLTDLVASGADSTHLLHFAAPMRDRVGELGTDAFVRMGAEICLTVSRLVERGGLAGLLLSSSGAVYADGGGYVTDVAANPYGAAKHLDELTLRQACRDAGTTIVVARVFSVSGPYMTKRHLYALGDLITQTRAGGPVRVKAQGPVRRSYVDVGEVLALGLAELLEPSSPELVFDATGEEVLEVGDLATRVGKVLRRPEVEVLRHLDPSVPGDDYFGDPTVIQALAKGRGLRLSTLDEQIVLTAAGWS